jgi:hypothetical protein
LECRARNSSGFSCWFPCLGKTRAGRTTKNELELANKIAGIGRRTCFARSGFRGSGGRQRTATGYYAVSVNALRGIRFRGASGLKYFQHFQPIGRAGYSIYIYHLRQEDCDQFQSRGERRDR